MSIVLNGQSYHVPGVETISWLDSSEVVQTSRVTPRRRPIHLLVGHTTGEEPPTMVVQLAAVARRDPFWWARYVNDNSRGVSWDATVRLDGVVLWHNDPIKYYTWHAGHANPFSIGVECEQASDGSVSAASVRSQALLFDFLADVLGIPKFVPYFDGAPDRRHLRRLGEDGGRGEDYRGFAGHRNLSSDRSDPGDFVYLELVRLGWRPVDVEAGEDLAICRSFQQTHGLPLTGVCDRETVRAMREERCGTLWKMGAALAAIAAGIYMVRASDDG